MCGPGRYSPGRVARLSTLRAVETTPLHARRLKLEEYAEREAAGENLWTAEFSARARARISAIAGPMLSKWGITDTADVGTRFLRELGVDLALGGKYEAHTNLMALIADERGIDSGLYPSLIEAVIAVHQHYGRYPQGLIGFERALNDLLAEERIAFRLVEGQMVELRSMEMHTAVIEPTIRLLHRSEGWEKVERSYTDALREIGRDPSNAITDAGTALQEALTLVGCSGNALGPLAKDAIKKGLFAAHDRPLLDWVSADRSEKGDGHKASAATRDDAWLAVHVVGALILRLASEDGTRSGG